MEMEDHGGGSALEFVAGYLKTAKTEREGEASLVGQKKFMVGFHI